MGVARVSQENVEALVQPTTQKARLTQQATEALVKPDVRKARMTQSAVEVLVKQILATPKFYGYIID